MLRELSNWLKPYLPFCCETRYSNSCFYLGSDAKTESNQARSQTFRDEDIVKKKDIIVGHPVRLNSLH